jgi:hypothetical protein
MSEATTETVCVAALLPPADVLPFVSLVAPVTTETVLDEVAVGVPLMVQVMLVPAATVAGVDGEQAPTVTPAGKPVIAQDAAAALAVAVALLVHLTVPL